MKNLFLASLVFVFSVIGIFSITQAQSYNFNNNLSLGMSGNDVSALQRWLISSGYRIPAIESGLTGYGYFGMQTRMAVVMYQQANGIPGTGYVGPLTRGKLNHGVSVNHVPVISNINGPTSLQVNQSGNWSVVANDPNNLPLRYSIVWGDEVYAAQTTPGAGASQSFNQTTSFSHTYSRSGIYTIVITVANTQGFQSQKTLTVNVGGSSAGPLRIISPNGGENWAVGTRKTITWTSPSYFRPTYADIKLVPDNSCPPGQFCTLVYRMPMTIASNIGINQNSYDWLISSTLDNQQVLNGRYTIQICEVQSNNCDSSDSTFTITNPPNNNQAPVINGLDVPTTLTRSQTGTWTIRATDPNNGTLSYSVDWGDSANVSSPTQSVQQSSSFTHSYSSAGTFTITFTVQNSLGLTAQTKTTVLVREPTGALFPITVTSPNGGEVWPANSYHQIAWNYQNPNPSSKVDIYLHTDTGCPRGYACLPPPNWRNIRYILDKSIPYNLYYNWIVATDINNVPIPAGIYRMQVCVADTNNCDHGDSWFTIQ